MGKSIIHQTRTYEIVKNIQNNMFLLFDIGGTKIRIAVADMNGFKGDPVIVKTPAEFEEGAHVIKETALALLMNEKVSAVVGGIAGTFDRNHEVLVSGTNITSWVNKLIKKSLENTFEAPVYLENDAALAGLGEAVMGAGRDYPIVGYMTVSTGVGGARITNQLTDQHAFGFEPGFQIVDFDGSSCTKCLRHDLSAHVSGKGIEDHYGKKGEDIHDPLIWEDITATLAVGVSNTILHWSPDVMVMGGSVMHSISIGRLHDLVKDNLTVYSEVPLITNAKLGDLGGLYGALHLAQQL